MTKALGKIICVGLGPGNPELLSVRADKIVRHAQRVAYFRKKNAPGKARQIVNGMLVENVQEFAMEYPVTTESDFRGRDYNDRLAQFYDHWSAQLLTLLQTGDMVILCEGDPFFYGSFMHLYIRLRGQVEMEIVPGITGMSAAWTASGQPMTWGDDVLTVVMATMEEESLRFHIEKSDALVVMKIGRNLPKLRHIITECGKLDRAWLIEKAAMEEERLYALRDAPETISYFSIMLIHGEGRRPC